MDVRPYAPSFVFLFPGPFVKVLSSFTSRMLPSILQRATQVFIPFGEISAMSFGLSWFLVLLGYSFEFFFHLQWYVVVRFHYTQVFISFLFSERSEFFFIITIIVSFSQKHKLVFFHWIVSNSKFPNLSRTVLTILAYLSNTVTIESRFIL